MIRHFEESEEVGMVNREEFIGILRRSRIVGAIKDLDGVEEIVKSGCEIAFVLHGDIVNIQGIVSRLKSAGKIVLVHIDLIDGLSSRDVAVDYIANNTKTDGIISTRPNIVKCAKACGLLTVQRFFVLDSMALNNIGRQLSDSADAIEILPGIMPKIIRVLNKCVKKPIIAGGLITDSEDVQSALNAGAAAISSSNKGLWPKLVYSSGNR